MSERLTITLLLCLGGILLYALYRQWHLASIASADSLLQGIDLSQPTIVYFTTPLCIPCKTQQQPALSRLRREIGDRLQLIQVDAALQPDVATRWGVQTAPTTFIIGRDGKPTAVNYGVADVALLRKQLQLI